MATQVQNRRGTTAEHSTFTGANGELTVDTTKRTLVVHDGSTAGGVPLLRENQSNLPTSAPTTGIYNASGSLAISTNSSERIRIGANGEIGIGGANYGTSGQVLTSGGSGAAPSWQTPAAANTDKIEEGNSSAEVIDTGSDGRFVVTTEGTERLRVDSSGRLGVGTTNFGGKLTVKTSSSNGAPIAWGDGQFVVTAGDGTTAPGFGISTNTSDNSISLSALTPGTGWNTIHYRAASHIFYKSDASSNEVGRWDSSGRLLVGTSTSIPTPFPGLLQVNNSLGYVADFGRFTLDSFGGILNLIKGRGGAPGARGIVQNGDILGQIDFSGDDGTDLATVGANISAQVDGTPGANDMPGRLVFSTTADGASSPTERMRIANDGAVVIGKTSVDDTTAGFAWRTSQYFSAVRSGGAPGYINRLTNDGVLLEFAQDSTTEGTISVSGTTVSYNGAHLSRWSQLPSGQERTKILRGSVLSNIDEMCEWGDEDNEQLNRMKVSDVEGDKNVSGVFQAWDDDDDTYTNDFYCAMTGDFIIRIGAGVTVERGDLLMSAGDGTAKPQDDDIIRSKTIAKVTSTNVSCTYDDGSYCVPCVLMAC